MNYYLIKNLVQEDGQCDYKGLDTNLIIKGTQAYPDDFKNYNKCVLATTQNIKSEKELENITEEEYLSIKKEIDDSKQNVEVLEQEKQELENQLIISENKNIGGIL